MRRKSTLGLAVVAASAAAIGAFAPSASADAQPQPNDAVIVGSDTLQFAGDFVADGSTADPGYNSTGKLNRIINLDATGDSNGRFTVAGGVSGSPGTGAETAVIRAGTRPVQRPNGSGAGVGALIADAVGSAAGSYRGLPNGSINIARMSRLPNSTAGNTEDAPCDANTTGCGGLHVYEIGNDGFVLAKLTTGSDAVPLDAATLYHVYNCDAGYTHWNDTNIGGSSSDTIIPLIPQSGSGTRGSILSIIDAANGTPGVDPPNLNSCATTVQEHDPSAFAGANGKQMVEPFSTARLTLLNTGSYFAISGTSNGTAANGYAANLITGITSGNNPHSGLPTFSDTRAIYLVVRQKDLSGTCTATSTPACFVPGGTKTVVQALITGGTTSVFRTGVAAADIADAGFTPHFQDCGVDPDSSSTSTNICVTNP